MSNAISAQDTRMYLENPNAAPLATGKVTAATVSKPAFVTFDDTTRLANGEPVYIYGSGWTSIDSQEWIIQNLDRDAKTASLANSNTTRETAQWNVNASYMVNAFADICAQSYQINQNPATSIDTTTLCDTEKTSIIGFRDPGTLTFDFFINPTDPNYIALHDAYDDGEERQFEIIYRNGAIRTLPVIVQSINETGGVDQAVHGAATLKITGQPVLTQPPSTDTSRYTLTADVEPINGAAPLAVTLTLTEENGSARAFSVDWGDGTAKQLLAKGTLATQHSYEAAGSFTPTVTATAAGNISPKVNAPKVTVDPPPPPVLTTISGTNAVDTAADGVTAGLVSFIAHDQHGAPMAGINLAFTTGSATAALGMPSGITDASGSASVNVTNTVIESVTVTATSGTITGTATVNFI